MKNTLFTLLFTASTFLYPNVTPTMDEHIQSAVKRVEAAREDTLMALKSMVSSVDKARSTGKDTSDSVNTQIIETHALSEMAKSTASVEVAKARAMTLITQAIDNLDPSSLATIANAVASVEIAKANAQTNIAKATGRVEVSKTKPSSPIDYPNETLTIAKNVSAIQIAKSVAQTEVARAVSLIEVAKSSIESSLEEIMPSTVQSKRELEEIKAKATANISTYLAQIEVVKANMLSKIATEVAKVEIAKLKVNGIAKDKEQNSSTYPSRLIKAH